MGSKNMIHFRDYEEYGQYRKKYPEAREERKAELILEENTIYEIDVTCEKCLEKYRRERDVAFDADEKNDNTKNGRWSE